MSSCKKEISQLTIHIQVESSKDVLLGRDGVPMLSTQHELRIENQILKSRISDTLQYIRKRKFDKIRRFTKPKTSAPNDAYTRLTTLLRQIAAISPKRIKTTKTTSKAPPIAVKSYLVCRAKIVNDRVMAATMPTAIKTSDLE